MVVLLAEYYTAKHSKPGLIYMSSNTSQFCIATVAFPSTNDKCIMFGA
jgi:hypothetical protein